jgi:hypothetical protein
LYRHSRTPRRRKNGGFDISHSCCTEVGLAHVHNCHDVPAMLTWVLLAFRPLLATRSYDGAPRGGIFGSDGAHAGAFPGIIDRSRHRVAHGERFSTTHHHDLTSLRSFFHLRTPKLCRRLQHHRYIFYQALNYHLTFSSMQHSHDRQEGEIEVNRSQSYHSLESWLLAFSKADRRRFDLHPWNE